MAAYGAAVSLKKTARLILAAPRIFLRFISIIGCGRVFFAKISVLAKAFNAMVRLQKVLLKLEETGFSKIRTKVYALDERIKEAIWEFEDLLESHVYQQILPQLESSSRDEIDQFSLDRILTQLKRSSLGEREHLYLSVDLQSLGQSVDSFVERVTAMEAEYDIELLNMPEEEGEPVSSRIDFGGINSMMVGSSVVFEKVRDYLIKDQGNRFLVTGMAGVGKTTLVKKVFEDPSIQTHFEHRAWVKVGRKCEPYEILRCTLAQVDPNTSNQVFTQGDDEDEEKLLGLLKERLIFKKCLIVLDDVWEWDTYVMDNYLAGENVRILVTSRLKLEECANHATLCLLNEDESNKLLGEKLFGEEGFPPHLKKLGETIAKKCEGLPLMLITVADFLSKEDKTAEFWTEVAQKQHNSVFMDSYNQISKVLFPSYDYLPQYLKMLFLYMGAFPPYSNIDIDNIIYMLIAEGFLEWREEETLRHFFTQCLARLTFLYNLVVLDREPRESWFSTKDFRVHSCWQYVCKKEASKIKFLHVIQSCNDDVMKDQRRLCAHCNTLFAFKQVYDSIKSDCAPIVRSLLCLGPYNQYPVPIHDMDLKLLRVLDATKVRFYHIPLEFMKLVCLRYLALTCNLEIPISISNLLHLKTLIIKPHLNIRKCGFVSYMPAEIWDMHELLYIEATGRDLPTPNSDATLKYLSSIFGVSAKSCTREILIKIPNLNQLGIIMELKPYDDDDVSNLTRALGHISEQLPNLGLLSYDVTNPDTKNEFMVPLSMFPSGLTMLDLSGSGCP
ncbi:putative late blight resistance protein homolog R1B-17 [Salvia hispanica]|uniref:putative late blight resistance protein homolog R1B-17 n=1 Tax=Salvia hispanica TaxID=49212 RepID=UPI002009BC49|nr:putative late blight resistance protein homolog R1B-17 [Salvia hispanica]